MLSGFEGSYREQCLQAYRMEHFTVTHPVSEFHYTLYYYDQAGNLVKTVPPEGVHPNRDSAWLSLVRSQRAEGSTEVPEHTMATQYRYNTLNQVVAQRTPDGGKSEFWYDRLGRLALSRNAHQKAADDLYSYTKYDYLGRITEVGQITDNTGDTLVSDTLTRNAAALQAWLAARAGYRSQVTTTVYDQPYDGFSGIDSRLLVQQRNLRNRVSYTSYADTTGGTEEIMAYNHATFYSYDIHGNVDTLLQDYGVTEQYPNLMNSNGNRFKKIIYDYDLISGKVNKVAYQAGWSDQLLHRYSYDAENRLTAVETSFDGHHWEEDARYTYYRHGPLARMTLGDQQVQGVDYGYTLQGWLKGVNSTMLFDTTDMGEDGMIAGIHQYTARDAVGYNLNYYDTADYSAISGRRPFPATMGYLTSETYRPLFNGNVSSMAVYNRALDAEHHTGSPLMLYNYRYDQLNRLTWMDAYWKTNLTTNHWGGLSVKPNYQERISYDGNGNIATYKRNANKEAYVMDLTTYWYTEGTNRLDHVQDLTPASRYGQDEGDIPDIDNQTSGNYQYDEIGNLIRDNAEHITNIKWSVYGKILEITRNADANNPVQKISYSYDPQGNRVSKTVQLNTGNKKHTWYVRDAQGNLLSVYTSSGNAADLTTLGLNLSEQELYGSSRLGIYARNVNVDNGPVDIRDSSSIKYYRGLRQYELTNHLGNVLATVSDKKIAVDVNDDDTLDYYDADIVTAQDYYPFGMLMPGRIGYRSDSGWVSAPGSGSSGDSSLAAEVAIDSRTNNQPPEYTATSSVELIPGFESGVSDEFLAYISEGESGGGSGSGSGSSLNGVYRYGFNGVERVNEIVGVGNHYTALFGEYDPRAVRRWNLDPRPNPSISPYAMYAGNPLWHSDPLLDTIIVNNKGSITRNDKTDNLVFMAGAKGEFISLGELGKKIDANEIYKNLATENAKEAKGVWNPFKFKDYVKTGGKWDLKNDKNSIFGLANILANKREIEQTKFLFEGKEMEAQDIGNHHFGVVGKAYGLFSEKFMLRQAGKYQINSGTSKPEWQKYKVTAAYESDGLGPVIKVTNYEMLPPYGDDPRDQEWIKAGFQFYKSIHK